MKIKIMKRKIQRIEYLILFNKILNLNEIIFLKFSIFVHKPIEIFRFSILSKNIISIVYHYFPYLLFNSITFYFVFIFIFLLVLKNNIIYFKI